MPGCISQEIECFLNRLPRWNAYCQHFLSTCHKPGTCIRDIVPIWQVKKRTQEVWQIICGHRVMKRLKLGFWLHSPPHGLQGEEVCLCDPAEITEVTKFCVRYEVFGTTGKQMLSSLFGSRCPSSPRSASHTRPENKTEEDTPPTPGQPFPTWSSLELPAHLCLSPLCPFSWSEIPKTQLANKLFFPNSIFYFKRAFFFVFFLETYALLQRCNLTHRCFLKGGTSVWGTFRSVWSFRLCNSLSNCCPGHCPAHLQKQASSPPFLLPYRIIQRGKIYLLYHMTPKLVSNQTSYRKRPGTLQMNVRKLAFGRVRLIHEHWWDFDFLWPYK